MFFFRELRFDQPDSRQPHSNPSARHSERKHDAREGKGGEKSSEISTRRLEPAERAAEEGSKRTDTATIATERKMKRHRNRVSSVLKNDNDQYLEGYGENYGAISSATDLEQEGLLQFAPIDVVKNIDKMAARKTLEENGRKLVHSAQAKVDLEQKTPTKVRRKLLQLPRTPKFRKKSKFKGANVVHTGTDEVEMIARIRDVPEPGKPMHGWKAESPQVESNGNSPKQTDNGETGVTIVVVNTSTGSSESELSVRNADREEVSLPMETKSVDHQVRRLQGSAQADKKFGSPNKVCLFTNPTR